MTRLAWIATAALVASILAEPAMARHVHSARPGYAGRPGVSLFCATRDSGNPHSKFCDYLAWSKWRQRGAWDSSLDNACLMNPAFVPGECSFNEAGQPLFGAHP